MIPTWAGGRPEPAPPSGQTTGSSGSNEVWKHLDALVPADLTRLLLRCGEGDLDAFDTFYRLTSPVLATLVAARLPPEASDAVLVEVYVTIWRRAHTFSGSGCSVWQWTLTALLETLARTYEPDPTATGLAAAGSEEQSAGEPPPAREGKPSRRPPLRVGPSFPAAAWTG